MSRIPPTNLAYIKTAMMTFAPLSREKPLNWGRLFGFARTNTKQEDVTVWVLGDKTVSVAVASPQLPIERTLHFRLERRVDVKTQFDRCQPVLEGHADQLVNRCLVEGKFEQLNHFTGGLDQPSVFRFQLEGAVVMELRTATFNERPTALFRGCDALEPFIHQTALHQRRIEDADVFVPFGGMEAGLGNTMEVLAPQNNGGISQRGWDSNEPPSSMRISDASKPKGQSVDTTSAPRGPLPRSSDAWPCFLHDGFDLVPLRSRQPR